jgi:hypothetical protein
VVLDGENCDIRLYWRDRLYMDLDVDGANIFCGVKALNLVPLPLYRYLPFKGKLFWVDTQGEQNPRYSELGVRYKLFYITEEEIRALVDQARNDTVGGYRV